MKKTVSSACGLKTCLFVLLIGAFLVLSFFTFICAAAPTTVQLTVLSDESGTVYSDGKVNDLVYNVGDVVPNFGGQSFLSFDISSIPSGSEIVDVVVDCSNYAIYGDPFDGSLGDGYLRAYPHDYGTLDAEDYYADSPLGAIMRYGSPEELNVIESNPNVAQALQGKVGSSRFQLRIQFTPPQTNNDGEVDVVMFQNVILSVTIESPLDFGISASPTSRSISAGLYTTYKVDSTSFGGFSDSVSLSVEGLPSEATGTFEPSNIVPTSSAILTVSTDSGTPIGTFTLTIIGSGGGLTRETTVTLETTTTPTELDETPPVAAAGQDLTVKLGSTVTFSAAGSTDNVGIVSYEWDFGDGTTGSGVTASHTYENEGKYNVALTVTDAAGNFNTITIVITVEVGEEAGFPYWVLIPIVIALVVAAFVIWYFFLRKKKEKVPKPTKIKMTVEKTEIMADGESTSNVTIELMDDEGKPIAALADTEIKLTTSGGRIKNPNVRILKGKKTGTTILISSKRSGKIVLSARAKGLKRSEVTVDFLEKPRFCMGCGNRMTVMDRRCGKCGESASDFSGPAKICRNCERNGKTTYLPGTADFCSECGAGQPKKGE